MNERFRVYRRLTTFKDDPDWTLQTEGVPPTAEIPSDTDSFTNITGFAYVLCPVDEAGAAMAAGGGSATVEALIVNDTRQRDGVRAVASTVITTGRAEVAGYNDLVRVEGIPSGSFVALRLTSISAIAGMEELRVCVRAL